MQFSPVSNILGSSIFFSVSLKRVTLSMFEKKNSLHERIVFKLIYPLTNQVYFKLIKNYYLYKTYYNYISWMEGQHVYSRTKNNSKLLLGSLLLSHFLVCISLECPAISNLSVIMSRIKTHNYSSMLVSNHNPKQNI